MAHIILGLALPEHLNVAAQADRTAREAGFTDAAHMNACFRPPTKWRRKPGLPTRQP